MHSHRNEIHLALLGVALIALTGCAASKPQAKQTRERPWIGGAYQSAATPKAARSDGRHFAKWGAVVTEAPAGTPVHAAGLQPSDLILAINGRNVRSADQIGAALENAAHQPLKLSLYRDGEFLEKTVQPGVERYQHMNNFMIRVSLGSKFEFDLWPNPDFSLLAIGYKHDKKRLDLASGKGHYLRHLHQKQHPASTNDTVQGLSTDEGWKAWAGPFLLTQNKVIVSQAPAAK